ncbi:hypothetical protein PIB30_008981 [Stylosanthes scabra]|uniref:Transmembrane protein n=1 Tax=Stylosanthes scabra TaxID=79078 RepID=A0ABU6S4J0_9FABA|nr:hypothetical protein [Stylosanthes scabra]
MVGQPCFCRLCRRRAAAALRPSSPTLTSSFVSVVSSSSPVTSSGLVCARHRCRRSPNAACLPRVMRLRNHFHFETESTKASTIPMVFSSLDQTIPQSSKSNLPFHLSRTLSPASCSSPAVVILPPVCCRYLHFAAVCVLPTDARVLPPPVSRSGSRFCHRASFCVVLPLTAFCSLPLSQPPVFCHRLLLSPRPGSASFCQYQSSGSSFF